MYSRSDGTAGVGVKFGGNVLPTPGVGTALLGQSGVGQHGSLGLYTSLHVTGIDATFGHLS